jgi:rRNA biogenesis protein RRP5
LKVEGFSWFSGDAKSDAQSASSSDEGSEDESSKKKKRRKKKEIEQDLTADMHSKLPESNADFERLLLGSPNSSYLWVQYMSFLLQLSEIDKARETGRRAIQTISFREEEERLNVWTALLNVENVYGTDESLEAVFKDAARHNDSKTVHLRLAAILDQSEKHEKAEDQYKRTCKKFGYSSKAWTLFCEYYLRRQNLEQARKLLPRALQSLEKRKHLKTISKFAQLEYKLGDAERGKTIFEGIVDSHPKRWDLWSIYMDMEAGQGDIQSLRNIFNRVFAIKMTSHKAKSFFKKWLELEHKIGDEEGASAVKQKAVEWTQKAASDSQ